MQKKDFDGKPHLLGLKNGVIDFETRDFREHQPKDYLSFGAPVNYDPKATCPKFDAFLHRAMDGDKELIAYLWRAIAYSLTGYVDEDVLFFSYGGGSNGKSTFNCLLAMFLGEDLSMNVKVELLTGKDNSSDIDYLKACLWGKRIILPAEIQRNAKLNEAVVKTLLGGEPIMARQIREAPFSFKPTHKIWWAGNHKPTISSTDHGIWRRIHLIPWMVTIPKEEQMKRDDFLNDIAANEFSGILNRALQGWNDYCDNGGLRPPEAVVEATNDYRDESDHFGFFLNERVEKQPGQSVKGTDLLHVYQAWCEDNGERQLYGTSRKLIPQMRDRGYNVFQDRNKAAFVADIAIRSVESF